MMIVHNNLQNAIELRLHAMVDVGLGLREARRVGTPVVLRPGRNVVDSGFWNDWRAQNANTMIAAHVVAEEEPPERPLQ